VCINTWDCLCSALFNRINVFGWALGTGRATSVPACPSAWRPLGPNPSYCDLLSPLHTLGVKVLSSHPPAPDAPNCADDVFRTRLTVLQLKRSGADVVRVFLQ